jgi:hypothetical protein
MLVRALLVSLLFWFFCLQQAMAEEAPPSTLTDTEQEPVASTPLAPPATVEVPEALVPPAPPATTPPAAAAAPQENLPPSATTEVPSESMDQEMQQRIKAYRELFDAKKVETFKRLEEARKREEAREKAYAEKVEAYLKRREERFEQIARYYDERRQSIVTERDYLIDHQKELLQMALDRKEAMIKREEDLRNEAQERKARMASYLSTMEDMTPQERHNYLTQHYKEMFERAEESFGAYPGGPQNGPPGVPPGMPPYGENPYSRLPAVPE